MKRIKYLALLNLLKPWKMILWNQLKKEKNDLLITLKNHKELLTKRLNNIVIAPNVGLMQKKFKYLD